MIVLKMARRGYGVSVVMEQHSSCCDDGTCSEPDDYARERCYHEDHQDAWERATCATHALMKGRPAHRLEAMLRYGTARLL